MMTENDLSFSELVKALENFDAEWARDATDRLRFSILRGDEIDRSSLLLLVSTLRGALHRIVVKETGPPKTGLVIRSYDPRPGA